MTRLNRIHPYPAMIADELAVDLSARFVKRGSVVVDPFCGTGRTIIAAASLGAVCTGIDINPLAVLVTRAKSCSPNIDCLEKFLTDLKSLKPHPIGVNGALQWQEPERRVHWFSKKCECELAQIVEFINARRVRSAELTIIAALLSATVREVSFARKDGWKLHRMSIQDRRRFYKSAKQELVRRLSDVIVEIRRSGKMKGEVKVMNGDCRQLSSLLHSAGLHGCDLIISSPPYGDSRTTVQYGAMSALSMGVLKNLKGIEFREFSGGDMDRQCLGGRISRVSESQANDVAKYWRGGRENPGLKRVKSFFYDLEICCREMASALRPSGRIVIVISRRLVHGWRVKSDEFIADRMTCNGLKLQDKWMRTIEGKKIPQIINCRGRTPSNGRRVPTMRREYVLVFSR